MIKKMIRHFYWTLPVFFLYPLKDWAYTSEIMMGYLFGIALDRYLHDYLRDEK